MLLSNKHARITMLSIFIIAALLTPAHTCNDKEKLVVEKKEAKLVGVVNISTFTISSVLKETVESSSKINVAEEKNKETETPVQTETLKATEKPAKLASNGKPYVYYKVYDFFYGSDKYHKLDKDLQEYTYELCIENEIEEYFTLILCQLYYESQYKTDVVSQSGDYGIAQINKCNHKWLSKELGITDFLDAKQSISCNIYMMSDYLKKYSVESSLFCYNTGSPDGSNTYSSNISYMWNNGVKKIKE